jgi:hypothetical protein
MHVVDAQDTPVREESIACGGNAPGCGTQSVPFHDSEYGRSPDDREPKNGVGSSCRPTATQEAGDGQDTEARVVLPTCAGACGGWAVHESPAETTA